MSLREYRRKRRFAKTPEPAGGLSFTVQKHDASHLHYDFRLEWAGVLKSWAVPKGPSLDPREKRLAVRVEDHPLEYGTFEGVIPQGEYGGGTVELWDHGTWLPDGDPAAAYRKGHIAFELRGKRYTGRWDLVRVRGGKPGKENWLLIKKKDEPALDPHKVPGSKKGPLPYSIDPQLCALVEEAPDGGEWLHELKLDGYRIVCRLHDNKAALTSRRGNDWTARFKRIAQAVESLGLGEAVLDGEVVALDDSGRSSFQALQNAVDLHRQTRLAYYLFDALYLSGHDLRDCQLLDRKKALGSILRSPPPELKFCDHVLGNGKAFFAEACKMGLEGIVSKRADAPYRGGRGRSWLKAKCLKRQEFLVGGYSDPGGSRSHFGALLLGLKENGGYRYVGKVGTGFTQESLKTLYAKLHKLETARKPFTVWPKGVSEKGAHWVEPALVAEIGFSEITSDGLLRQPRFEGLREDKTPDEVRVETPQAAPPSPAFLTHPTRVLYPEAHITKRDLADYYTAVAPRILPEISRRPLALVRCPSGYKHGCFFQKHVGAAFPESVHGVTIQEKGEPSVYPYIEDLDGLLALAQMGVLEIHPWGSAIDSLERPDRVVFDLDPGPGVAWEKVARGAFELRELLVSLGLRSWLKVTGGKGLHVVVPLEPRAEWDAVKAFTKAVAESMAAKWPDKYTAKLSKSARGGKIFVDYLRNGRGATAVGPYSTRARAGATVAVPISWEELTAGVAPDQFTVRNARERLSAEDPWQDLRECKQSLTEDAMTMDLKNRLREKKFVPPTKRLGRNTKKGVRGGKPLSSRGRKRVQERRTERVDV
jgi:bifunctional non-homologous end joining protein LigD